MEWSREQIINLIEQYRERPYMWNQTLSEYKDKNKKHSGWCEIAKELEMNTAEVQNKFRNITTQFFRELKKEKSGSGAPKKPKWFAFDLLTFLRDKTTPRHSRESVEAQEIEEIIRNDDDVEEYSGQDMNETPSVMAVSPPANPTPTSSKRPRKRAHNPMAEQAYTIMKKLEDKVTTKDEFDAYGVNVAYQLRKSTNLHDLAIAKKKINDALFDLEMATYNRQLNVRTPSHSVDCTTTDSRSSNCTEPYEQYLTTANHELSDNDEESLQNSASILAGMLDKTPDYYTQL